jgi:hypothetical protein
MRDYRIYCLRDRRIIRPSTVIQCATEEEAIRQAQLDCGSGLDAEVWDGPRRVWMSAPVQPA